MADINPGVAAATQILGDAAAPYALFSAANRYVGTLVFDVTVREVHTDEDTITVHPVQTGTPISDHVFANPQVVEITAACSDSTAGYDGFVEAFYQQVLALKATRQPFEVSTGKRLYESMLFGNITVVTDETSEYALMVTARLQQVIITGNSGTPGGITQANQANPADTAPEAKTGTQTLQPAPGVQPLPAGAGNDAGTASAGAIG